MRKKKAYSSSLSSNITTENAISKISKFIKQYSNSAPNTKLESISGKINQTPVAKPIPTNYSGLKNNESGKINSKKLIVILSICFRAI